MALPAARGRAAASEPGPAEADPDAPQPDALPQEPDPRPPARDEPAAQGHAGHRHQARLRRHDMMGRSGRAMLDALVSGTTDPVVLADLARGLLLRKKLPALREA